MNWVVTLVSSRVVVFPVLQEFEELLRAALLKETHERALDCLHLRAGDLGNPAIAVYEAASDLLELQVPSDFGVNENLGQFTGGDDKLGDQVDSVVSVTAELAWGCLIWAELAVELAPIVSSLDTSAIDDLPTWVRFKLALSPP